MSSFVASNDQQPDISDLCEPFLGVLPSELGPDKQGGESSSTSGHCLAVKSGMEHAEAEQQPQVPQEDECNDVNAATSKRQWYADSFITWILMPTLMYGQFAMAYTLQHKQVDKAIPLPALFVSVTLFMATSWVYRNMCKDCEVLPSQIVTLLPEVFMDTILLIVLIKGFVLGFYAVLIATIALAVIMISISSLYLKEGEEGVSKEASNKPSSKSALVV